MPETTKFTALGKGNGFNQCVEKLDINTTDQGGVHAYSTMTFKQAMKIHWLWYGVTCDVTVGAASVSGASYLTDNPDWKPYNVVCDADRYAASYDEDSGDSVLIEMANPIVYRLYDGDTTDEANFLGYGVSSIFQIQGNSVEGYSSIVYNDDMIAGDETLGVTISGIPLIRLSFVPSDPTGIGTPTLDFFTIA